MNLQELQEHANEVNKRLDNQFGLNGEQRLRAFAHMIKIQEEVGELSEETLIRYKLQREQKLNNADKENLEKEVADVIFATCTFAANFDINLDKVLTERIELVKKRYQE